MDKKKKKVVLYASIIGVLVIALVTVLIIYGNREVTADQYEQSNYDEMEFDPFTENEDRLKDKNLEYGKVLSKYASKNYPLYSGEDIYGVLVEEASENLSVPEDFTFTEYEGEGLNYTEVEKTIPADSNAVYVSGVSKSVVTYTFNVTETAWYCIDLDYLLPEGKDTSMLLGITINGESPFKESGSMELSRMYGFYSIGELDVSDNEIRAKQQEIFGWQSETLQHAQGLYKNPYRFLIQTPKEGETVTVELTLSREPGAIKNVRLTAPEIIPSYEDYLSANSYSDSKLYKGESLKFELEVPDSVSNMALRMMYDYNYASSPAAYEVIRYNVFGGDRWSEGGDSVMWTFNVAEDGWYQLAIRYNTTLTYVATYRDIEIDGEIPFEEFKEYCFPYSDGWVCSAFKDADQNPYLVYLTAGEHTMTLTSKVGPLRHTLQRLDEIINSVSTLLRKVIQITGSTRSTSGTYVVDKNRDWDLDTYIPSIRKDLAEYRDSCEQMYNAIKASNGGVVPYYGSAVKVAQNLFDKMNEDIEDVPSSINEINNALTGISDTMVSIKNQPLMVDYMLVSAKNTSYKSSRSNFWQDLTVNTKQFILSFTKDYSSIGARKSDEEYTTEITVYVARGREYVDIMRNMIAEMFTPETKIKVDLNMVAGSAEGLIMLRYVAGTAPDVSISIGAGTPVEYAIRGALMPLNDLDRNGVNDSEEEGMEWNHFDQLWESDYLDGSFIPYLYRGDYYAFPETQGWGAMFYRTDIMEELELDVPETWDDVYKILPILQEENMDFYYPYSVGGYFPFLFQYGGSLYDSEGMTSALNTEAAYNSFVEYANLYIKYKLPYTASFYQRFRSGDMPIGLADLGFYSQISYAAPELADKWAMAPIPGHVVGYNEDGSEKIARYAGGNGTCCIIIKKDNDTGAVSDRDMYEPSWKFIEWWMSAEVQTVYAQEVEATFGIASRWNPANKNAVANMAYSEQELSVIMTHWDDELGYYESPSVLGGYYTSRYLLTALNQAVVQGDSARIALEDAVKEINKEMERKQKEFNITDSVLHKSVESN